MIKYKKAVFWRKEAGDILKKAGNNKPAVLLAVLCFFALMLTLCCILIAVGNSRIEINEIKIESERIPESFKGFRIAQVSDLHNGEFGEGNEKLLSRLSEAEPHIIAITGDLIDSYGTKTKISESFVEKALEIAPVYYVCGNHEGRKPEEFRLLVSSLEKMGATVLRGKTVAIEKDGERIMIAGIDDPNLGSSVEESLSSLETGGKYTVLLSHRAENFEVYVEKEVDLVLCGHAHGGQFILPLVGGVYAPGQGFFPKYYEGAYTEGNTTMIVSRGLGNSVFPFRINNSPEIVVAVLS